METPQEPQNKLEKIICPIVTVWVLFLLNIIIYKNGDFLYYYDHEYYYYNNHRLGAFPIIFYLFIFFGLLAIGVVITLSIEKNNYKLYFIGFIMSIIFEILTTIGIIKNFYQ